MATLFGPAMTTLPESLAAAGSGLPVCVEGLGVAYGGHAVLRNVDLTAARGEFVAIVGRSGSGKSSLLLALAGLIPRHGHVCIPGRVGFVFQNNSVFPWLTVIGNVAFGLNQLPRAARREAVARHLALVGLESHASKYPGQLSGGQVQRVALAMVLAPDPDVVMMDEPFSSLDAFTRENMQEFLLEIHAKSRKTILFVTHDIDEAIYLADRIVVLGSGGVAGEFPVPFERPRIEEVRFATPYIELKRRVLERLKGC
jgi:NitT/TauT family transport system ATP-binding protein